MTQPESESGSGVYNNEIGSIVVSGSNADGLIWGLVIKWTDSFGHLQCVVVTILQSRFTFVRRLFGRGVQFTFIRNFTINQGRPSGGAVAL